MITDRKRWKNGKLSTSSSSTANLRVRPLSAPPDDAIEFLLTLPSDGVHKVADRLSALSLQENPFCSRTVRKYLRLMKEHAIEKEYKSDNTGQDDKVDLFEKCLTTSDVGSSNRLVVTPKEDVRTYLILSSFVGGTENYLRLEDEEGKPWLFGLSYLKAVNQSFVLTKCWRSFVKEKQLDAGDFVFFQRHLTDTKRLFIGCRKCESGTASMDDALLNSTSPDTSAKALEFRDKLKEVETHFQPKLSERNSITGSDPVFVIYCGDNQDSEEVYLISYIFNELRLRGFIPLRYDLTRSLVTGNLEMLYGSRVGIIIFSMNYAHSRECMDELVEIMGHLKTKNVMIIPVFFKVSFSEVRAQSGSFEEAFTRLGNSVQAPQVLKWRGALLELSSNNKYQYRKGDEVILAKNIIGDVCLMVKYEMYKKRQGMRSQMNSILPLLQFCQSPAPHIVGLWGMAGIGKTTVMGDIVRTQAERYDVCYFQPDFHLMCQTKGLSQLREEFFSKIFGEENVFKDACDTKLNLTRDRLLDKRVLIVLDGVSSARDAEAFVGGFGWFSGGHTVIFTSRNRQVLVQCNAKEIYRIQKLSEDESIRLCCHFDAKQDWKGKMSELVKYASGIPLALRAFASSVKDQYIKDEKNHLRRLRQHPPVKIQDAFRISFDGRDDNEKSIFLDLACFFRGEYKERVVDILDGCGFFTDIGIYGLIDESLISLVDNRIEIPNVFQDTGRFFVLLENKEPGKRSRLWDSDDIADVLINNSGTEAIEGIFLDLSGLTFALSPTVFERMYRLRLLKLHCPTSDNHCKVALPEGLHSLPDELRLLHWERYPLGSLPRNFNPKKLVELNMPYSNLTKLWKGTKNLDTISLLPSLILHSLASRLYALVSLFLYNAYLADIPDDLCWLASVKTLDLGGNSFSQIPESIKELRKLHSLGLRHCKNLRSIPELPRSLEILNAHGCVSLESLPSGLEQLPRHSTFSNCFSLSQEVVRKFVRKVQHSFVGMPEGHQLEHSKAPSFSICMPASAVRKSLVNLYAGSSVLVGLTPGMLKTVSGVALSVVVEFLDSYSKAAGFGIKCICRMTGTDLAPRQERVFQIWAPKEAPTVQKDHLFVFGCANIITGAEGLDHDILGGRVAFDFHPVDWENNLLDDKCTVKKCGVRFITDVPCDMTLSTKRPSSMDSGQLYSVEDMAPPFKRCRLKTAIEFVILALRKRKREKAADRPRCQADYRPGSQADYGPGSQADYRPGSQADHRPRSQADYKPRSQAEVMRRKRISNHVKKLKELVPNMDKKTDDVDMLDLTAAYIKDLESQYKNLKEKRAYCKCMNKEKASI